MGGNSSKPAPLLLDKPWREINFKDKQGALQNVNNYRLQTERQQLRILLHGPVGAGKSSFINSVQSVLRGSMCSPALVANISGSSFTKKYTTYKIPKGDTFYPFVLNDMMGLQERNRRSRIIHVKDVKRLLKGHIKDGYTFNPECNISKEDRFYNQAPTANSKVHVLVFVIDANTESLLKREIVETIQDIRDEASELGIPQVAIFTKVDKVCPEIEDDLKNVYRSKILQQRMENFSVEVGLPMNCIFAVKNYHSETNFDNDTDTLILHTLSNILNLGDDVLKRNDMKLNDQEGA